MQAGSDEVAQLRTALDSERDAHTAAAEEVACLRDRVAELRLADVQLAAMTKQHAASCELVAHLEADNKVW
jgi:hypothetical protein